MPTQDPGHSALDMLILKALSLEPMHGWGISQRLHQLSREVLQINQGTLYPALHRLERERYITSEWRASENNRRAKYYAITTPGRKYLRAEQESWDSLHEAVRRVMLAT
jgi:transcriptional regulator